MSETDFATLTPAEQASASVRSEKLYCGRRWVQCSVRCVLPLHKDSFQNMAEKSTFQYILVLHCVRTAKSGCIAHHNSFYKRRWACDGSLKVYPGK